MAIMTFSCGTNYHSIPFRALDPIILPTQATQAAKQRILDVVRSLSKVLAFAYCLSR